MKGPARNLRFTGRAVRLAIAGDCQRSIRQDAEVAEIRVLRIGKPGNWLFPSEQLLRRIEQSMARHRCSRDARAAEAYWLFWHAIKLQGEKALEEDVVDAKDAPVDKRLVAPPVHCGGAPTATPMGDAPSTTAGVHCVSTYFEFLDTLDELPIRSSSH